MFQYAVFELPPLTKEKSPLWGLEFGLKDLVHGGGEWL